MNIGELYDNEGEQLQIVAASAFEVKYRKRHWRPIKDVHGRHTGQYEPYYHTYTIGTDRAYLHIENKFWNKTEPKINHE